MVHAFYFTYVYDNVSTVDRTWFVWERANTGVADTLIGFMHSIGLYSLLVHYDVIACIHM